MRFVNEHTVVSGISHESMIWNVPQRLLHKFLENGMTKISHPPVQQDEITKSLSRAFEYSFDGVSEFTVPDMPDICGSFNIGLIVGASGSGKSTLLKRFGEELFPYWFDDKCIASHFDNEEDAMTLMGAVGLNSVPTWFRPYSILSVGEQYRADLSRRLVDNAVIDEFTSVVNRSVAKSCAHSVAKHIRKEDIQGVVFSSCHYDIAEWLEPDWIYDTATGELTYRGSLHRPTRRPEIKLDIIPCGVEAWSMFKDHHYLTEDINASGKHWLCWWGDVVVGFASAIPFPSGTLKNAFRGHRTVVLPDFQGLGIGVRLSDAIAQMHLDEGKRYFSKTAHPRMGKYRNESELWKPTSKNMRERHNCVTENLQDRMWLARNCFSYSHEYIGDLDD